VVGFDSLIPGYVRELQQLLTGFYNQYSYLLQDSNIQQLLASAASQVSTWATGFASQQASNAVAFGQGLGNAVLVVGVSMIVGFWVLIDLPGISHELLVIIGPRREADARFLAQTFSHSFGGYLKGILINGSCTGVMAFFVFWAIGLPYPVVFALLAGLMNFVPFIGPWIAGITAGFFGLFVSPLTGLLALAGTIIPQGITDNLISPRVMSSTVELHPAMTLVMVFAGASLGGIFGMVCAIPLTAAAKAIFVHYFQRHTGRTILSPTGAFFKGDPKDLEPQPPAPEDSADKPAPLPPEKRP
jgi:predicted PurR-regulated permease PerM